MKLLHARLLVSCWYLYGCIRTHQLTNKIWRRTPLCDQYHALRNPCAHECTPIKQVHDVFSGRWGLRLEPLTTPHLLILHYRTQEFISTWNLFKLVFHLLLSGMSDIHKTECRRFSDTIIPLSILTSFIQPAREAAPVNVFITEKVSH